MMDDEEGVCTCLLAPLCRPGDMLIAVTGINSRAFVNALLRKQFDNAFETITNKQLYASDQDQQPDLLTQICSVGQQSVHPFMLVGGWNITFLSARVLVTPHENRPLNNNELDVGVTKYKREPKG